MYDTEYFDNKFPDMFSVNKGKHISAFPILTSTICIVNLYVVIVKIYDLLRQALRNIICEILLIEHRVCRLSLTLFPKPLY